MDETGVTSAAVPVKKHPTKFDNSDTSIFLSNTLIFFVFAISISSYIVPALMGGWKVMVMPLHVYQQIAEMGKWQFGSAIAVVLFCTSLLSVIVYQRVAIRIGGGRA